MDEQPKKSHNELIYDEHIAPLLKQAGDLCVKHGFPFIARVQYDYVPETGDSAVGDTAFVPEHTKYKTRLAYVAMKSNANVDKLIGWIEKEAKEKGHSSIYLHFLEAYRKHLGLEE